MALHLADQHGTERVIGDGERVSVGRRGELHLGPPKGEDDKLHRTCYYVSASGGTIRLELPEKRLVSITVKNVQTGETYIVPPTASSWTTNWNGVQLFSCGRDEYWIVAGFDGIPPRPPAPSGGDEGQITHYEDALNLASPNDRALIVRCLSFMDRSNGTAASNTDLAAWLSTSSRENGVPVTTTTFSSRLSLARIAHSGKPAEELGIDPDDVSTEDVVRHVVRWNMVGEGHRVALFGDEDDTRQHPAVRPTAQKRRRRA